MMCVLCLSFGVSICLLIFVCVCFVVFVVHDLLCLVCLVSWCAFLLCWFHCYVVCVCLLCCFIVVCCVFLCVIVLLFDFYVFNMPYCVFVFMSAMCLFVLCVFRVCFLAVFPNAYVYYAVYDFVCRLWCVAFLGVSCFVYGLVMCPPVCLSLLLFAVVVVLLLCL